MTIIGQLLYRKYQFSEAIALDLYGYPADEHSGYEVTTATLPGSDVCLAELLSREQLATMSDWLDRHMKPGSMEELIDRAEDEKLLRQFEPVWRTF